MITATGVAVPEDMAQVLESEPDALTAFQALRPADQREYVDWLAKRGSQTRAERLTELAEHIRNHQHRPASDD